MSRLDEIKARLEAATLGPWDWFSRLGGDDHYVVRKFDVRERRVIARLYGSNNEGDCIFIADAPEDVDWLVAEVERLANTISLIDEADKKYVLSRGNSYLLDAFYAEVKKALTGVTE